MEERDIFYLTLRDILKDCRLRIIEDTLEGKSDDLYDALYDNADSEIFNIKLELYELGWIELHWKRITDSIEKKDFTNMEKRNLISAYAKWYEQFVSHWNYSELDVLIIEDRMNILRTIISANDEWDQSLKKMEVSFSQSRKELNTRIKELKKGS